MGDLSSNLHDAGVHPSTSPSRSFQQRRTQLKSAYVVGTRTQNGSPQSFSVQTAVLKKSPVNAPIAQGGQYASVRGEYRK